MVKVIKGRWKRTKAEDNLQTPEHDLFSCNWTLPFKDRIAWHFCQADTPWPIHLLPLPHRKNVWSLKDKVRCAHVFTHYYGRDWCQKIQNLDFRPEGH